MPESSDFHEKATLIEKIAVLGTLGGLAAVFAFKGQMETATGFAAAIVTYATSRVGV